MAAAGRRRRCARETLGNPLAHDNPFPLRDGGVAAAAPPLDIAIPNSAAPGQPADPQSRKGLTLPLIVASALFMQNLDSTVLATSLPAIARSLDENPIELKLALTSYILALAVWLPASGWLADRFGARHIFRIAIIIFALGSIGCGFAGNLVEIVACRIVQGIGGAMMVPVGRLIVLRSVPKRELVGAMAWMTIPALIGPLVGPLVGGFITTYFDWRWIFWINVPIAVLGLVLATIYIPDIRGETRRPFDVLGFALIGLGIFAFVTGSTALGVGILETTQVVTVIAGGAILLVSYALYSRGRKNAIIDLTLFQIPSLRIGLLGGALARLGVGGTPFLLPLMLQYGFGMTPFESGAVTFVGAAGAIGLKTVSTRLIRQFGFRRVAIVNSAITAVVVAVPGLFYPGLALPIIYAILLFAGFFRALQLTTTQILGFVDVPTQRLGQASTLTSVLQQTSMSLGISAAALALQFQVGPGGEIGADDFFWPFLTLGCLSLLSAPLFWALRGDVGQEVSGHRARVAPAE